MAGARVLGIPAHVGGIGSPLGSGGHRNREAVGGCRSRCDDRRSSRRGDRPGDQRGAREQRRGSRVRLRALGLEGGLLDDGGRGGLGGLEVIGLEGLLALGPGGDEGQLQSCGKRASDDGGLDRIGPAGDELPRAGGGAVVAAGVRCLVEVPGRPGSVLPHAQVDAYAFGQVGTAGPGEAGDEEAVDLERVGQKSGVRLRVGGCRQDRRDRSTCRPRRPSDGGHGAGCTEHRRRKHRGSVTGAADALGRRR